MGRLEDRVLAGGLLPGPLLGRIVLARVKGLEQSFDRLTAEEQAGREAALAAALEAGPITVNSADANRQHYELPPEFFGACLGPRYKYSSCYWGEGIADLSGAEDAMLELTAERAGLADGQTVLDLGCGWGSFSLWAAERWPHNRILAVSNSRTQREFIEKRRQERGLGNLEVVTAEVGEFDPERRFDRVVSVEMFEHVRNHRALMQRVAGWLEPEGRLFVHIFCHRRHLYAFEMDGSGGWMARYFFSGGIMPSWDYLPRYQDDLDLLDRWEVNGRHYAHTLRAWRDNLDRHRDAVMPLLVDTYGRDQARLWFARWRIFFTACEETFALDAGRAYFVGHYLFAKR